MSAPIDHPLEGQLIDRYLLHRQIGQGGMASVFLAERLSLEVEAQEVSHRVIEQLSASQSSARAPTRSPAVSAWVAVKIMHPHLARDERAVKRFIAEIALSSKLHHPNICPVLDVGELEGAPYIVLPYLKGRTLGQLAELEAPPPPEVIASLWLDLARGLSYAHNLSDAEGAPLAMIHRDISPQNSFVEYRGAAQLLDFGIARLGSPERRAETSPMVGKVSYMAPEQLEEEAIDQRVDVWALAVTIWELCAHRPLFTAQQPMRAMYQVLHDELLPPSTHTPPLPTLFDELIAQGLEREVERRPWDAVTWVAPLEGWLKAHLNIAPDEHNADERFERERKALVAEWMERHFELHSDLSQAQVSATQRAEALARFQAQLPLISPLMINMSADDLEREAHSHNPSTLDDPQRARPKGALIKALLTLIVLLSVALILWKTREVRPRKVLKINAGETKFGDLFIKTSPCPSRVYLLPQRALLGQTPLHTSLEEGVYQVSLEPYKRSARTSRACLPKETLIEIKQGREERVRLFLKEAR